MSAWQSVLTTLKVPSHNSVVGAIGLDCSLTELHLVQMEIDDAKQIQLRAQATLPFPHSREEMMNSPKLMRSLVQKALRQEPFKGRSVVSTLPSDGTTISPVTYKVRPGQSEAQAIASVMSERVGEEISDYVLDYLQVRSERADEHLAIVAMAKREIVIDYLELLRLSGVVVDRLEIGPVAIRRLIAAMGPKDQHENVIALNFGRQTSFLTVISGRRLLLDQTIAFGEDRFLTDIVQALDLPIDAVQKLIDRCIFDPLALATECQSAVDLDASRTLQDIVKPSLVQLAELLNRTLIYIASQTRGEPVNRIYLLGSLARWRGIGELLNTLVRVNVETVPSPIAGFCLDAKACSRNGSPSPETAIATGLALGGIMEND